MSRFLTITVLLLAISMNVFSQTETKFLALGDSYTIGESVSEDERWPNQLADKLKIDRPKIIATTGWRTDDLKGAINSANLHDDYDLVSLLIGVNNQYQGKSSTQYEIEFEDLLKTAIQLAKGKSKNVFVVSIPDYGFTPFGKAKQETISLQLDEFNKINQRITEKYKIKYFSITEISRKGLEDPALVAADGLHPSGKMYTQWVEVISKGLK